MSLWQTVGHEKVDTTHSDELDWIEQGLTSPPTQYRLSGRQFYRWKDPTNSIKVLKETLASHRPEEAQKPTRGLPPCYKWTSEKRKTLSQWVKPSVTKPHRAGWPVQVLYRTIDCGYCATTDATQHFSKTGLGILYPNKSQRHQTKESIRMLLNGQYQ